MLAELGLGLAGFAGVAAAFGGRSRVYGDLDLIRLMVLFFSAGSVVAGSLAIFTLDSFGLNHTTVYLIVSAVLAPALGVTGVPILLHAYRTVRDPEIKAPLWVSVVGTVYFTFVEALYVINIYKGGEAGPLIAAFSVSLVYGLWMFTRLLVHPN